MRIPTSLIIFFLTCLRLISVIFFLCSGPLAVILHVLLVPLGTLLLPTNVIFTVSFSTFKIQYIKKIKTPVALRCFPSRRQKWLIEHAKFDSKKETYPRGKKVSMEILMEKIKKSKDFSEELSRCSMKASIQNMIQKLTAVVLEKDRFSRYIWTMFAFAISGISGFQFRCRDHILRYLETNSLLQV